MTRAEAPLVVARRTTIAALANIMASVDIKTEPLIHVARKHLGPVRVVALSAAPRRLALCGNVALVLDCTTWESLRCFDHPRPIRSAAFDRTGTSFATACGDSIARVWDVESGRLVLAAQHAAHVSSVFLSATGRYLATGCVDGSAHLVDLTTHAQPRSYGPVGSELESVFMSNDDSLLLTESKVQADLWDVSSGYRHTSFPARGASVLAHEPLSSAMTVSTTSGATVLLWNAFTGECLRRLDHPADVNAAFLTGDGMRIFSACEDGKVRSWVSGSGECVRVFEGHADSVESVVLSASGGEVVSGGKDETGRVWDAHSGRCRKVLEDVATAVIAVLPSPDGRELRVAGYDATVASYDLRSGRCERRFAGHAGWVSALAHSRDGALLATGSHDGTAKVWRVADGRCAQTFASGVTYAVALLDGGRRLLTGSQTGLLQLWDVASGTLLACLGAPAAAIRCVATTAAESVAVVGSDDGSLRWWDLDTGRCLRVVHAHRRVVHELVLSPDERFVFSGSCDGTAKCWDADRCCKVFAGPHDGVRPLCISPDGRRLYAGGYDGSVTVWDTESGARLNAVPAAHGDLVRSLRLTADGGVLISGSKDGTIRFWDAGTLDLRATLRNLRTGFLWTTPPDGNAPSGWLWTNREDLIDVRAAPHGAASAVSLEEHDPRRRAYLEVYNSQERTLARLKGSEHDRSEALTSLVALQTEVRAREPMRLLEHRPRGETPA